MVGLKRLGQGGVRLQATAPLNTWGEITDKLHSPLYWIVTLSGLYCLALWGLVLLGLPPAAIALSLGGALTVAGGMFLVWQYPVKVCGLLLLTVPLNFLVVACLKFIQSPLATPIAATKEGGATALILVFLLKRRRPFRLLLPDYCLLILLAFVCIRQVLGGTIGPVSYYMGGTVFNALRMDFDWVLLYVVGRLLLLDEQTMDRWSRSAIWLVSLLTLGSAYEIFILGPEPRQLLYASTFADQPFPTSYVALGYGYIRASATLVGPLEFGILCMVALVALFAYKKPVAAAILPMAGLILSVSRASIIGAAIALFVLAVRRKKFITFTATLFVAVALLAYLIPLLGLTDLVSSSFNKTDPSLISHQETIREGWDVVTQYPFGLGSGTVGPDGRPFESSYLTLSGEFGIFAGIAFIAFLIACVAQFWTLPTKLGDTAIAIIIGFSFMMIGQGILQSPYISYWVWLPIGMAIAQAENSQATGIQPSSR
jgi:hypothetical protein